MAGWCERENNDVEMWNKWAVDGRSVTQSNDILYHT